jgi:bifunctional non-homologous end joining protein LigD
MQQKKPARDEVFGYDENALRFVLQEHFASHHHWDFRLELDGALKSWALPKGMPRTHMEKRLAVQTEDHPLEYIAFEGVIPGGQYGAGTVSIDDSGTYTLLERGENKIEFVLHGKKYAGRHVLVRLRGQGKNWLLIRLEA